MSAQLEPKPQDFITSTAKKGSIKTSGLFYLIEKLLAEKHALARKYKIISNFNETHPVFLVVGLTPAYPVFENQGYLLQDCHLTIEGQFSNETSYLGGVLGHLYAHATLQYRHATKETLFFHIYFNSRCEYVKTRINEQAPEAETEAQIKLNLSYFSDILRAFIFEKLTRIQIAQEKAAKLEHQLAEFEGQFSDRTTVDNYLGIAEELLKAIAEINAYYDEEIDRRDIPIRKRMSSLKTLVFSFPRTIDAQKISETDANSTTEEQTTEVPLPTDIPRSTEEMSASANVLDKNKELFKDFVDQHEKLKLLLENSKSEKSEPDLKILVEAYNLAKNLENLMLDWEINCNFNISRDQRNKMADIKKTCQSIALFRILKICVQQGDVNQFIFLVEKYSPCFTRNQIFSIIGKIVIETTPDIFKNQIEILNFLFKISEGYRNFILTAHFEYYSVRPGVGQSLLMHVANEGNFQLFSLLLEQGYNPNSFGCSLKTSAFSLIKGLLTDPNKTEYLKILIQKGAQLNLPIETILTEVQQLPEGNKMSDRSLSSSLQAEARKPESIAFIKQQTVTQNFSKADQLMYELMSESASDLLFSCKFNNMPGALVLAQYCSPIDLILAFSDCVFNPHVGMMLLPIATDSSAYFSDSQQASMNKASQEVRPAEQHPKTRKIKFIFTPHPKTPPNNKAFLIAKGLYSRIQAVFNGQNKLINQTIQTLERQFKDKKQEKIPTSKIVPYYNAIAFLIAEKGLLSYDDMVQLMDLKCRLAFTLSQDPDLQSQHRALAEFRLITDLATASSDYQERLIQEKIYRLALQKIKGTAFAEDDQSNVIVHAADAAFSQKGGANARYLLGV